MRLLEQQWGEVMVIRPEGPLTGDEAQRFTERFVLVADGCRGRCVVDASAVPFVDSKGLEALVRANTHMTPTGRPLKLCGINETIRQVLELTELEGQFEYFDDVSTAVRSFL